MTDTTNPGRSADDDDRCQMRRTILMLNLAVAQINNAMRDSDASINTLTGSFTDMMQQVQTIARHVDNLAIESDQTTLQNCCTAVSGQMQASIMAFQFYDKLNQRLNHLTVSLADLAELVSKPETLHDPNAWHNLQEKIKTSYTVDTDKTMFEAILQGATVEEALSLTTKQESTSEEIELF